MVDSTSGLSSSGTGSGSGSGNMSGHINVSGCSAVGSTVGGTTSMASGGGSTCTSSGNKSDRFVCPSDRQLALRAKLKTGWSIKTGSLGQPHPPANQPLSNIETEAILAVVKRAEQEERKEAERVGKLIDRLENMRRMALGKTATECLLCGETFGMLSGGPRMICADCRKMVCNKCGVETPTKTHKELWLCKICSETREMWKKSGAWFFHGVPQYILPPNSKILQQQQASSSSSGATSSMAMARSPQLGPIVKPEDTGGGSSGSDDDAKKAAFYSKPARILRDLSSERITNEQRARSNTNLSDTTRSTSNSVTFYDAPQYLGVNDHEMGDRLGLPGSVSPSLARLDSFTSRSDIMLSDEKASLSGSSGVSGASSIQGIPETHINTCALDTAMGTIELTIHYDSFSNVLHCTVHRAKNLTAMDINGLADPFCKLNILPTNNPSTRLRTKTVHKTRNPEFNETVTFYGITDSDVMKKSLHILVLDDDKYGYDFLGEAKVSLNALRTQHTLKVTTTLCGPSPAGDYAPDNEHICSLWGDVPNTRGQILIALTYNTKRRALIVGIIRCSHLPPMDSNGFSDPFVKLHLSPDPHHKKYKTSIKWKTLNPIFNEEFAFETRPNELTSQSLRLTVWDKDYGKSNDYLGGLVLGNISKGKRLKHWLDVIKFPDHRHEAWHYLTEDMVTD